MVAKLFEYFTFEWRDPSGYPYEGIRWSDETRKIDPIRQYTQITAIGQAAEFLAGIVNGEMVFRPISMRAALDLLALMMQTLQRDQDDPRVSENGLPVAFIEFDRENSRMRPPIPYEITPDVLPEKWGEKRAVIWDRLLERKWLVRKDPDSDAFIVDRSAPGFGLDLGQDLQGDLNQVNEILNRRTKQIVTGDTTNLLASLVSAWGRLFMARERSLNEDGVAGRIAPIMEAIDQRIAAMRRGFREDFFDRSTGMLRRGFLVYDADGLKHKKFFHVYHNFSDEFISGILLAKVIYGLPLSVVRNVSVALKEYVDRDEAGPFYQGSIFRRRVCHSLAHAIYPLRQVFHGTAASFELHPYRDGLRSCQWHTTRFSLGVLRDHGIFRQGGHTVRRLYRWGEERLGLVVSPWLCIRFRPE